MFLLLDRASLASSPCSIFELNYANPSCGVMFIGSILGPILFSLYMLPFGHISCQFKTVAYHCCADNTQFYVSFKSDDLKNLDSLHCFLTAIKAWMSLIFFTAQ